jgi:hypothetical protein
MAYAKGARTFERHIDIEDGGIPVSPYCTLPEQCDEWFKAFHKAREMSGGSRTERRQIPEKERTYLDALVRGVYVRRDLPAGHVLTEDDVYLAVPAQKGQLSPREFMRGEVLTSAVVKDEPLQITQIDSPYANIPSLRSLIADRGCDPQQPRELGDSAAASPELRDPAGSQNGQSAAAPRRASRRGLGRRAGRRGGERLDLRGRRRADVGAVAQREVPLGDALDRLGERPARAPAEALPRARGVELEEVRLVRVRARVDPPLQRVGPALGEAVDDPAHRAGVLVGRAEVERGRERGSPASAWASSR